MSVDKFLRNQAVKGQLNQLGIVEREIGDLHLLRALDPDDKQIVKDIATLEEKKASILRILAENSHI